VVTASRRADGTRAARRLNEPRPVDVRTGDDGLPAAVTVRGRTLRLRVTARSRPWRTDDRWWTSEPISRFYVHLTLEDGRSLTVFRDLIRGRWYEQRYA
jgi:hypothetical protein